MPETLIENVLTGKLDSALIIKWLNNEPIEDDCILLCCKKGEFVACFLSYLRTQTESILLTNNNAVQILQHSTPEKALASQRKHHRSISEPTSEDKDSLCVRTDTRSHESPSRDRKRPGRRVKTKLFSDDKSSISISSDESRLSSSIDRLAISSTPVKNGLKPSEYPNLLLQSPVTPRGLPKDGHERCDTPRLSHRHSRSHEKSCLGDYLVTAAKSSKKKTKKNVSNDTETLELDLSNPEMFPEIGARKSSSLRGEKKRIKPTNIDKSQKSLSLNSFSPECFQQASPLALVDNSAFKQQKFHPKESANSFEVERNLLKQERHKLMEKFNILNTASPQKSTTMPQITISRKESVEQNCSYIKADVTKIILKDKIDLLIDIYDNLFKNNLILCVNTEIYFLISILISRQLEDDYLKTEINLNDNNIEYLLRSIHNSSYFAVKSLWNIRVTLEVILDKNSLKTLGENKQVRSLSPELAKFLLNGYCARCEAPPAAAARAAPAVRYNTETDCGDNFPATQAFHTFKRQRDMFYEIFRWYQETQSSGGSQGAFRTRVRSLVAQGGAAACHAHLAALVAAHMAAECLPGATQESKLSKLQRRLTCPAAPAPHRLPGFTPHEMFYKEFIMHADNEPFRVHLKDTLSTEIVALDATQFGVEDRGNSTNIDISREYLPLAQKLILYGKFLGYVTALPYSPSPTEVVTKNSVVTLYKEENYITPKEKVLENSIALRNYSQPTIDIMGLLSAARAHSRLAITLPWLVRYLAMLDYAALRLDYHQRVLATLLDIYHTDLTVKPDTKLKKNTIIYLKSTLGWLFSLPHFTEIESAPPSIADAVDSCELVDDSILELCPWLRDVNLLLATNRLEREAGSCRHITPVSLNVDPGDRSRNKEMELQARLEEELLKSQPSSTRRVLEMVVERVTSAAVRELTARELRAARERAREHVARALAREHSRDHSTLLAMVTAIYSSQLRQLAAAALESARGTLASRARVALAALLPAAPEPLQSVAVRRAKNRLAEWINDHWNTTAVLCKDIESEMKTLLSLGELRAPLARTPTLLDAPAGEGPATVLIQLKEHVCLVLEGVLSRGTSGVLAASARAARHAHCRAPTQRALLQLTGELCLAYVAKRPKEVTDSFLSKLHAVWNTCCPDRQHHVPDETPYPERREDLSPVPRNFTDDRLPTPISDEDEAMPKTGAVLTCDAKTANETANSASPNAKSASPNTTSASPTINSTNPNINSINSTKSTSPNAKSNSPNNKSTSPNAKSASPNTKSASPTTKSASSTLNRSIIPNMFVYDTQIKIKSVTPLKRITPISQPFSSISPMIQQKSPISQQKSPISQQKSPTNRQKSPIQSPKSEKGEHNLTFDDTNEHLLEFFDRILCPRNIVLLSSSDCKQSDVWEALAFVLVYLLRNDYLSEDSLTEQCLAVYRQDWPQNILENLSTCMKAVSSRWSRSSSGKFTLFLDFLAEFCGDMDYEITE